MLQMSHSVVKFALSGALAAHLHRAQHKCELNVQIKAAPELTTQQFPPCSQWITTYNGVFKNPCKHKGTCTCMCIAVQNTYNICIIVRWSFVSILTTYMYTDDTTIIILFTVHYWKPCSLSGGMLRHYWYTVTWYRGRHWCEPIVLVMVD